MYRKTKILLIFLSIGFFGVSQSLEADLELIAEKMNSCSSVSIGVFVNVKSSKDGASIYKAKAELQKRGGNSRSVLGEMESLRLEEYDLRIDHEEKMVLVVDKENLEQRIDPSEMDIDVKALKKLLKNKDAPVPNEVKLVSNKDKIRKYAISGIQGMTEVIVVLDMNRLSMKSISYEYESSELGGQFVELIYETFEYDINLSEVLNTAQYFFLKDDKIVLHDSLKEYTLYTEE